MNKHMTIVWVSILLLMTSACSTVVKNSDDASATSTLSLPTSVQLWGVKDALKNDFEGTLKQLAELGFDGVEFANYFGPYKNDPQGLKDYLDSIGLKASGAHLNFKPFRNDFFKTVAFYKTIGVDTIIIPMDKRSFNPEQIDEFITELNDLAERLNKYGIKTGYHNHWQELQTYQDATYWDYIGLNTTKNVILQLDIGWVNYSEKDAIKLIEKFPGRSITVHLKPKFSKTYEKLAEANGHYAMIGRDNFDWQGVIRALMKSGGTKWFVIEQEEYPLGLSPLAATAESKVGFETIINGLED